jgi:hypothetical protein
MPFINTGGSGGGGGGSSGGFAWPSYSWAAEPDRGIGGENFDAVDIVNRDGGIALDVCETQMEGKVLRIRPTIDAASLNTKMAGAELFSVGDAEEGVWAIKVGVQARATATDAASPTGGSSSYMIGCALHLGATYDGVYVGGFLRRDATNLASITVTMGRNTGRDGYNAEVTSGAGSAVQFGEVDFLLKRVGTNVEVFVGRDNSFARIGRHNSGGSGMGAVSVLASSTNSIVDVSVLAVKKMADLPLGALIT